MKFLQFSAFIALLCCTYSLQAAMPANGAAPKVQQFINHKEWSFVENKGQIPLSGKGVGGFDDEIKFYGHQGGVYLYCKAGMISFVFTKTENSQDQISEATGQPSGFPLPKGAGGFGKREQTPSKTSTSRTDLVLLGSNPNAQIIASDKQEYYENYYTTGDADHGITNVQTYKTITYKSIYPNIDMVLTVIPSSAKTLAAEQGMEYSFIVHPGGKVSDIQLQWNGTVATKILADGSFKFSNSLGTLEESAPKSFVDGKLVASSFTNTGFKVGKYDEEKDLVIDPTITWATYYGGKDADEEYALSIDHSGNIYMTGYTESSNDIATSGAYQTSFLGGYSAFVAKFNSSGNLLWGTYINGDLIGLAVCNDKAGNVYFAAYTSSPPVSTFLAKFNSAGVILWYNNFGVSNGNTYSYGLCTDDALNLYMTGTVGGTDLATSGAYQTSLGGNYDAFLAKFDSNGRETWTTYFGGSSDECGNSISIDGSSVYVTGYTGSSSSIATYGAYQTAYGGGMYDGFLAKFDTTGSKLLWATYYGGDGTDNPQVVRKDGSGNVYITGFTTSATKIATSGAYQTSWGGYPDVFLAKFNGNGKISWSTYFGGDQTDESNAICIDSSGYIYIAGITNSGKGIATSNAYQSSYGGGAMDCFLAKFGPGGKISWATYYGGSYNDYAYGIGSNGSGNVYISGYTGTNSGIATSGAYQTKYGGGAYDCFLSQFHQYQNDAGIISILNPVGTFCQNNCRVTVTLKNFGLAEMDSVNILWSVNKVAQKPYHWSGKLKLDSTTTIVIDSFLPPVGQDTIMAWTFNPNGVTDSIASNDKSVIIDTVNAIPSNRAGGKHAICYGNGLTLGSNPIKGYSYLWNSSPPGVTKNQTNSFLYVGPDSTTTYILTETITNTGCSAIDSVKITVNPLPAPHIDSPQTICGGTAIIIGLFPVSGQSYSWTSNPPGFTSTSSNPSVSPAKNTIFRLTQTTDSSGCSNNDSVMITVNPSPAAAVTSNTAVCPGVTISIGAISVRGSKYSWTSSPSGFSSTSSNPSVSPGAPTKYKLTETDSNGCSATDSVTITVNPLPTVAVASNTFICSGASISIGSTAVPGSTYSWTSSPTGFSSTSANPTVSPTSATKYVLTETNSNRCSATDSVTVTVNPLPTVAVASNTFICSGALISIGSTAVPGSTYSWTSSPTGFSSTSSNPSVSPISSIQYKLIETNSNGCSATDSVTITVNPLPAASVISNTAICAGSAISIGAAAIKGSTYSWADSVSGFSSTSSNPSVSPISANSYTLTETNSNGCIKSNSVVITVNPLPDANWTTTEKCEKVAFLPQNDTNTFYQWFFGDRDSSQVPSPVYYYKSKGSYTIKLITLSSTGCKNEFDSSITISCLSGIEQNVIQSLNLSIFPNPFQSTTSIAYSLNQKSRINIVLIDVTGKQIGTIVNENQVPGDYQFDINAEKYHLSPGIYLMKFMMDDEVVSRRLVKF